MILTDSGHPIVYKAFKVHCSTFYEYKSKLCLVTMQARSDSIDVKCKYLHDKCTELVDDNQLVFLKNKDISG